MSDDIGQWYADRANELHTLEMEREAVQEARAIRKGAGIDVSDLEQQLAALDRRIDQARYVGD